MCISSDDSDLGDHVMVNFTTQSPTKTFEVSHFLGSWVDCVCEWFRSGRHLGVTLPTILIFVREKWWFGGELLAEVDENRDGKTGLLGRARVL